MQHILKTSHEELERTHTLAYNYKEKGFEEIFFSFIGKSFRRVLFEYAQKKEAILEDYKQLYADLTKDIHKSHASPTDIKMVNEKIIMLTESIELCGNILEQLIAHSHRQEEIVHAEKIFFTRLLENVNTDLMTWVASYEQELFGESSKIEQVSGKTPLESGKNLLELQKHKLQSELEHISKL